MNGDLSNIEVFVCILKVFNFVYSGWVLEMIDYNWFLYINGKC